MYKISILLMTSALVACGGSSGGGDDSLPATTALSADEMWSCASQRVNTDGNQDEYGLAVKEKELWNYSANFNDPVPLLDAETGKKLRQASTENSPVLGKSIFDFSGYSYFTATEYTSGSRGQST